MCNHPPNFRGLSPHRKAPPPPSSRPISRSFLLLTLQRLLSLHRLYMPPFQMLVLWDSLLSKTCLCRVVLMLCDCALSVSSLNECVGYFHLWLLRTMLGWTSIPKRLVRVRVFILLTMKAGVGPQGDIMAPYSASWGNANERPDCLSESKEYSFVSWCFDS